MSAGKVIGISVAVVLSVDGVSVMFAGMVITFCAGAKVSTSIILYRTMIRSLAAVDMWADDILADDCRTR